MGEGATVEGRVEVVMGAEREVAAVMEEEALAALADMAAALGAVTAVHRGRWVCWEVVMEAVPVAKAGG